jgi:hypothetical protein
MFDMVAIPQTTRFDPRLLEYESVAVTGRVVDDATGAPIEGAVMGSKFHSSEAEPEGVTDADGRFRLEGVLRAQLALVTVKKSGYVTFPLLRDTPYPPGDPVDVGDLRLRHGALVAGTVTSPEGPIADAEVSLVSPSILTGSQRFTARTGADGRFRFPSAEAGRSYLHISATGFIAASPAPGGVSPTIVYQVFDGHVRPRVPDGAWRSRGRPCAR